MKIFVVYLITNLLHTNTEGNALSLQRRNLQSSFLLKLVKFYGLVIKVASSESLMRLRWEESCIPWDA